MTQPEFDFNRSTMLRDDGMNRAELNAELHNDGWSNAALEAVRGYARTHKGVQFMAERVREWAHTWKMVPEEKNGRAWGAIMLRAAKLGIIRHVGYGLTENVNTHKTPASLWMAA